MKTNSEWLPIKTAPKDKDILVLQHGVVHHVRWGGNFHNTFKSLGVMCEFVDHATHWMPVLQMPKGLKGVPRV